jgi:hypothetical protein
MQDKISEHRQLNPAATFAIVFTTRADPRGNASWLLTEGENGAQKT